MRFSIGAAFLVAGVAGGYITAMQALSRAGTAAAPDGSKWVQELVSPKDPYSIYAVGHFKTEGLLPPPRTAQLYSRLLDEDGKALRGDCSYRISGAALPVRWWAVHVAALNAPLQATSFSAADAILTGDDRLDLVLSRRASPGNWMLIPEGPNLKITLTLYEAYDKNKKGNLTLPALAKMSCE